MTAIVVLNLLFPGTRTDLSWISLTVSTVCFTLGAVVLDGVSAFIIRRLPAKWFDYKSSLFTVTKKERIFYKAIGVKSWRSLVLELGVFTSFSKKHFAAPGDPKYTERFLLESCYGIVIHIVGVFIGFILTALYPALSLRVALPVATVNAVLNLLPIFVLRYNLPKIKSIHERNLRRSARENG